MKNPTTYYVEVLGAESDDPPSYYRVAAYDESIAVLVATLIDQYIPARPIEKKNPHEVDLNTEIELAKSYAKVSGTVFVSPPT